MNASHSLSMGLHRSESCFGDVVRVLCRQVMRSWFPVRRCLATRPFGSSRASSSMADGSLEPHSPSSPEPRRVLTHEDRTQRGPAATRPARPARLRPERGRPRGPVSGEAVNALKHARGWAEEIASGDLSRTELARREGLSRARITHVLALLELPADLQEKLRSGDEIWSVRRALREVGRHYS